MPTIHTVYIMHSSFAPCGYYLRRFVSRGGVSFLNTTLLPSPSIAVVQATAQSEKKCLLRAVSGTTEMESVNRPRFRVRSPRLTFTTMRNRIFRMRWNYQVGTWRVKISVYMFPQVLRVCMALIRRLPIQPRTIRKAVAETSDTGIPPIAYVLLSQYLLTGFHPLLSLHALNFHPFARNINVLLIDPALLLHALHNTALIYSKKMLLRSRRLAQCEILDIRPMLQISNLQ